MDESSRSEFESEVDFYRRLLREKQQQLEAAEERAHAADERADAAEERADALGRSQRPSTYPEYLKYCHEQIFLRLKVEQPSVSSTGSFTDVKGKYYPYRLKPWSGFLQLQTDYHAVIDNALEGHRVLPSYTEIIGVGANAGIKPIASELGLREFESLALENPVTTIFDVFGPQGGHPYKCRSLSFFNEPYSLPANRQGQDSPNQQALTAADLVQEELLDELLHQDNLVESEADQDDLPIDEPDKREEKKIDRSVGPDRWCIGTTFEGKKRLIFTLEYKAAHKLEMGNVREVLRDQMLFVKVASMQRRNKTEQATPLNKTRQLMAQALTQTFDYMINHRGTYGYLTAGRILIFLGISPKHPRVLYYYLSEPEGDTEAAGGVEVSLSTTAFARLAAFSLFCCRAPRRSHQWQRGAKSQLRKWPEPYPHTPDNESSSSSGSEDDNGDGGGGDGRGGDSGFKGSSRLNLPPSSMVTRLKSKESHGTSSGGGGAGKTSAPSPPPQYCTEMCLLGLKRRDRLDEKCPNVSLHRFSGGSGHQQHPIDLTEFASLLRAQLGKDLDRHCESLDGDGLYGARGAMFQVTLAQYGYTFLGKGTHANGVRYLQHEGRVYRRLEELQGKVIPVYLGNISLMEPYSLMDSCIVHMLLMSWAGKPVTNVTDVSDVSEVDMKRLLRLVLDKGVNHGDLRKSNILWNADRRCYTLIDFDRATFVSPNGA